MSINYNSTVSPSAGSRRILRGEQLSVLYRDIDEVFSGDRDQRDNASDFFAVAEKFYKGYAGHAIYSPSAETRRMQ